MLYSWQVLSTEALAGLIPFFIIGICIKDSFPENCWIWIGIIHKSLNLARNLHQIYNFLHLNYVSSANVGTHTTSSLPLADILYFESSVHEIVLLLLDGQTKILVNFLLNLRAIYFYKLVNLSKFYIEFVNYLSNLPEIT